MNKTLWIEEALKRGFDSFEIYQRVAEEKTLNYFDGALESFVTSHVLGTSFRGLYQGKMASMATEDPGDDSRDDVLGQMIDQAKAISSKDVAAILKPEKTEEVHPDKTWVSPESSEVLDLFRDLETKLKEADPRIVQVSGMTWSENREKRQIVNSYGMDVEDGEEVHYLVAGVVVTENNEVKDAYKIEIIEDLSAFDREEFVKKLTGKALAKLGSSSLKSGMVRVLVEKDAMTSLFSALSPIFSGELIGRGVSPLKDKLNEQIFSKKIDVIDDPKNTEALNVVNYDDEGHPTRRKEVVKEGVFTTILFDSKAAARMNAESTGNGFKGSYASPVSVRPKNMYIRPGELSYEELEQKLGEGLVIEDFQGLHAGIDAVTTDFSLQCSGYYVKDGKKERSVSLITAAGNFLDLMKKVEEVGNDLEWSYHNVAAPSILFKEIAVSGE